MILITRDGIFLIITHVRPIECNEYYVTEKEPHYREKLHADTTAAFR